MTLVTFRNRPISQQHSLEAREKFQPGRFPSRLFEERIELPSAYSSSILPSNFCRNRARVVRREIARHYSSTLETRARIVNKRERERRTATYAKRTHPSIKRRRCATRRMFPPPPPILPISRSEKHKRCCRVHAAILPTAPSLFCTSRATTSCFLRGVRRM